MSSLDHLWQYITGAIVALAWFFRLEGKANLAHSRIDEMEKRRIEDIDANNRSRNEFLHIVNEIRSDIKEILKHHGAGK